MGQHFFSKKYKQRGSDAQKHFLLMIGTQLTSGLFQCVDKTPGIPFLYALKLNCIFTSAFHDCVAVFLSL